MRDNNTNRYWYDPNTGEILRRTLANGHKKFDLPYFDRDEKGWVWSNYKVDIASGEIVPTDNPNGQGVDPRPQPPTIVDPDTVSEI